MSRKEVVVALEQIQNLAAQCLRTLRVVAAVPPQPGSEKDSGGSAETGLPDHIIALRSQGFFKEPRTAREVQQKLRPVYSCEVDRVSMALLRLKKRKELRKASRVTEGKRQVAYVW